MRRGFTLIELIIILTIVLILGALIVGPRGGCGCGEGYSEGDRTGVVTKLSYKGMLDSTKSWEAEMNLGGLTSGQDGKLTANVWKFTIEDEEVLKQVKEAQASQKTVTIHYTEWLSKPGCRSETGYFATKLTVHEPPKPEKK